MEALLEYVTLQFFVAVHLARVRKVAIALQYYIHRIFRGLGATMAPKIRPPGTRVRFVIVKTEYFRPSARGRTRPPKEILSRCMYDTKDEARMIAARWRLQDVRRAFNRLGFRHWICVSYKICELTVASTVSSFLDTA